MKRLKELAALIASDCIKLTRMKSVYIGVGVMAFVTLIFALAYAALGEMIDDLVTSDPSYPADAGAALASTFLAVLMNGAPAATGVFLLTPIIAALFVGGEFSSGMARLYVGRGMRKTDLYLSKFIVLSLVTFIYVCLSFAMGAAASAALDRDGSVRALLSPMTADAFGSYVFLSFVFAAIYTSLCFIIRSKAGAMATLIAMLIFLGDILVAVVQMALAMQPTGSEVTTVWLLFDPYYLIDAFASAASFTAQEAGVAFGGGAMWTVLFFVGGALLNERSDT